MEHVFLLMNNLTSNNLFCRWAITRLCQPVTRTQGTSPFGKVRMSSITESCSVCVGLLVDCITKATPLFLSVYYMLWVIFTAGVEY